MTANMQLIMQVPSPNFLFFLTILLPAIFVFGHIFMFYKVLKNRKTKNLKWEALYLLMIVAYFPLFLYQQAIVQSTTVLATDFLNDYIGVVTSAAGYGSLLWNAIRFMNVFAVFVLFFFIVYKLLYIPKEKIHKRFGRR